MTERKLVTVETIRDIKPIEKADAIEIAVVRGWEVVVKKGQFKQGDKCIFYEVDSFLPDEKKYEFLKKGSKLKKNHNGNEGIRLRTIKLRGQISQGLIMALDDLGIYKESDNTWKYSNEIGNQYYINPTAEEDLSRILNVEKYERPVAPNLAGKVKGNFPSFIPKTDQERIQNLINDEKETQEIFDQRFEITLKLDGTSATYYKTEDGTIGACSRNLDLKLEDESSVYVKLAKETNVHALIPEGYAIQGEIYGQGIQDNHDKLPKTSFFLFDVWSIKEQRYMNPFERGVFFKQYLEGRHELISHVPIIGMPVIPSGTQLEGLLQMADNTKSINNEVCEGLVFKRIDGKYSFKAISNKFLLQEK